MKSCKNLKGGLQEVADQLEASFSFLGLNLRKTACKDHLVFVSLNVLPTTTGAGPTDYIVFMKLLHESAWLNTFKKFSVN